MQKSRNLLSIPLVHIVAIVAITSALVAGHADEGQVLSSLHANATIAGERLLGNVSDADSQITVVNCLPNHGAAFVDIVNDTELIKLLAPNTNISNVSTPAVCMSVLFYSKTCPFSSLAAPHFNALSRAFPDIRMIAINAITYHLFNAQNGIVAVPTLLLLHNGKLVDKFNESEYTLEHFSRFITKNTGIAAENKSYVTSADFAGPVYAIPNKEADVLLFAAWTFITSTSAYLFSKTNWWRAIVEYVQSNWRECEAAQSQHEHFE